MKDRWKSFLDDRLVLPVQVPSRERAARVADDDAVRVQHRYNLNMTLVLASFVTSFYRPFNAFQDSLGEIIRSLSSII